MYKITTIMFRVKFVSRLFVSSNNYINLSRYINYNLKYSLVNIVHNNLNLKNFSPVLNSVNHYCVSTGNSRIADAFFNLNTNYREQQRIYKSDIESLIEEIKNEGLIDEDNSLLLLQCCGNLISDELPSTRIALVQEIWQTFINKNIKLNVQHYNALLQSYVENRMSLSYKDFLGKMNCEPNEPTYDLLLECVCENGDINQAIEIVNIMKEKGLSVNEPVFSSLIMGHLRCGDFKSAQNILETMRIAHIVPSSRTYTALLRGCAEAGDTYQFGTAINAAANREFTSKQLISILYSVCLSENMKLLPLIKKTWSSMIDSRSFEAKLTGLCTHLIHIGKPLIAYELFKCLVDPEVGFVSESDTYGAFLFFESIRANMPSNIVIKLADDLIKSNRNSFALYKATEIALRIPDVQLSLALLHALYERNITLRNHYFWPILIHKGRLNGGKGIFEIFDIMLQYKLNIAQDTLEMCSLQYMNEMDPDVIISRLKQYNLTVKDIITPLSIVLLRAVKIKEVADLGLKYKVKLDGSRLVKPLTSTYISSNDVNNIVTILQNILLKNQSEDWAGQLVNLIFTRSGEKINYEQVLNLLKAYKIRDIKISVPCADKIEHVTNKIRDKDIKLKILKALNSLDITSGGDNNHYIPHPRDMNLEELECHLIELRNKKMETRGILRKLIQMHCRFGNAAQASALCTEFEQAGYTMSPGMKAGVLDLYIKSNQFKEAWNAYNELKDSNPSFKVDEFKVIDLARLLVNNNMTDEAVKILKNESTSRQVLGGKSIEHNCWNLLDSVARTGTVLETKTIFKLLVKNGYCTESNTMLGPLIRVHICNDNLNEAVEEFLNCCIKYNKTPLLHELLCTLVQKEMNEELIKKAIEATALVHGNGNAQMSLAIALAETGYVKSLRKLLMESNALISMNLLEKYCQRCMAEGKSQPLKNLIISSKGIAAIDLSAVYFSLMSIYSSNNNTESTLTLWNDMQESHIIPSDKTKNLITNLINKQKHPPTNK